LSCQFHQFSFSFFLFLCPLLPCAPICLKHKSLSDATILELEKTLLDATAKFRINPNNIINKPQTSLPSHKCYNNQANVALNYPMSALHMCNYDADEQVTRSNNNDEHNVMHLQNLQRIQTARPTTTAHHHYHQHQSLPPPVLPNESFQCHEYLNVGDNECSNNDDDDQYKRNLCKSNADPPMTMTTTTTAADHRRPSQSSSHSSSNNLLKIFYY